MGKASALWEYFFKEKDIGAVTWRINPLRKRDIDLMRQVLVLQPPPQEREKEKKRGGCYFLDARIPGL